jgi:Tat protein translocase TatB subunit
MFDFSFGELALIGTVALVVLGPERLPKVARTVGEWIGKAQRYVNQVKTDINREMAQKGWTSAPALPGSCSLFPGQHYDFAAQIASEQLKWKQDTPTGLRYEWHTIPGRHDYGDCMAMAFAAADFGGIRTGGKSEVKQAVRTRMRVRHINV